MYRVGDASIVVAWLRQWPAGFPVLVAAIIDDRQTDEQRLRIITSVSVDSGRGSVSVVGGRLRQSSSSIHRPVHSNEAGRSAP